MLYGLSTPRDGANSLCLSYGEYFRSQGAFWCKRVHQGAFCAGFLMVCCNGKLKLDTKGCILGQSIVSYWTEEHPNVDRRDQNEVHARRTNGDRPEDI